MTIARHFIVPLLVTSAAVLLAQASRGAVTDGWYVQGGAGANWQTGGDIKVGGSTLDTDYDIGWMGALSGGYAWRSGLRLELEFGYRENGVDSVAGVAANGDTKMLTGMVNAIYGFPAFGSLVPYVGVGVGAGRLKLDSIRPLGATSVDDSDIGVAFQGIAGVEYALSDNLGLGLSYRYMYAPSFDFTAANGAGVSTDYRSHAVMVALRWSFGAPAPVVRAAAPMAPPAPAPQPAPPPRVEAPRPFLVFFDWDSSTLSAQARNVLQAAAQAAKQNQVTRIELTGHADRSGTDAYNLSLSQRRADAVKAELVRLGIAANQVSTIAKGESQPLVPTADGVQEPQNRRVEIVFPPPGRPGA
jgi:outer membrane protein OmpA-like peptidoglycan-associated protein